MAAGKSSFLGKVLGRIGRLDAEGLQTVVQRLAQERHFLETIFNTIEDGVVVVDPNGRIIFFNQAVIKLVGLNPDAAEGQQIQRVLPELDWERLSQMDFSGGARTVRHEFEIGYPRPRFLRVYGAPLDGEKKGASGLVLILHDATEARQATHEAIESERVQALTLLAASVAHEIGNPINALHIHLQLMERELKKLRSPAKVAVPAAGRLGRRKVEASPVNDADRDAGLARLDQYIGVAKGEITRLDYIITQFLQAIRPSAPQLRAGSLNEVAHETLALLRPELENRGLLVREELARVLPNALVDQNQIKQVLVNLIKNAMQAMSTGGVITVSTGTASDGIWVSVADTGGGIPQEQLSRIFEPFYTTKKKGTGLGLMIVQRIIREHGGKLEVESHLGEGSTFRVRLPMADRQPRLLSGGGEK